MTIDSLSWLAGTWSCEVWDGRFEEVWLSPLNNTIQGVGRFEKDGAVEFMEFMSIEQSGDSVVLYMILGSPSKGDKSPVPFVMTGFDGTSVFFERSDEEYPKRIIYSKPVSGKMVCRIEGVQDGEESFDEFNFEQRLED